MLPLSHLPSSSKVSKFNFQLGRVFTKLRHHPDIPNQRIRVSLTKKKKNLTPNPMKIKSKIVKPTILYLWKKYINLSIWINWMNMGNSDDELIWLDWELKIAKVGERDEDKQVLGERLNLHLVVILALSICITYLILYIITLINCQKETNQMLLIRTFILQLAIILIISLHF